MSAKQSSSLIVPCSSRPFQRKLKDSKKTADDFFKMIKEGVAVKDKAIELRKRYEALKKEGRLTEAKSVRKRLHELLNGDVAPSKSLEGLPVIPTQDPEYVQWASDVFSNACKTKEEVLKRISPKCKARKYVIQTVAKLGAFCDHYKYLPNYSVIRISTVGGSLFHVFKRQTIVSRLLKVAEEIGLVKIVDNSYSNTQHFTKTRILNKDVLHFCLELVRDFKINPSKNSFLRRARFIANYVPGEETYDLTMDEKEKFGEGFVEDTFNVDFSAGLRIAGCTKGQAVSLLYAKYPQIQAVQRLIDADNLLLPVECQVLFRPKIHPSSTGFITKIGIRATSQLCSFPSYEKAVAEKKDVSMFNGLWREDYIRQYFESRGIDLWCKWDQSASIYTLNNYKKNGVWEDGDMYQTMFGGSLTKERRNLYKHNFSMQGMFDWSAQAMHGKLSEYIRRFESANRDKAYVDGNGRLITYSEQLLSHYRDKLQSFMQNEKKDTSIFLDESCIYAIVAHYYRKAGYEVLQVYDGFWVGKKGTYITKEDIQRDVKKVAGLYFKKYYGVVPKT